ncbi:hypothetical protein F5Y19DRAFT_475285 [Xylariaceae sp. FL1651]|nr:hypothetical protein F5Y19DRAFT_475285 [Xylariaceae sp. FL1651]
MPLNTTTNTSSSAEQYMLDATAIIHENGLIPVSMMKCFDQDLDWEEYWHAKEVMVKWSESGKKLMPNSWHAAKYPPYGQRGVTIYVCNCKWFWRDSVPRGELDDMERILKQECGSNRSGWVWSKKWQKGFNVVPTEWFEPRVKKDKPICPPSCLTF